MINLADVLRANPGKSPWAAWLTERVHPGAHYVLGFLELGLGRLNRPEQRRLVDRLQSDAADNVDAVLYQLMAFEVCHRLGLQPEYEPKYGSKTPDLRINISGCPFAAEAFRCSRPLSTLVPDGYQDAGNGSKDPPGNRRQGHGPWADHRHGLSRSQRGVNWRIGQLHLQ